MRYPIAPQGMAHPGGVEPPTSRLTVERSNHTELWVNIIRFKTLLGLIRFKTLLGLIPPEGLEPSTFRLEVYCAIQIAPRGMWCVMWDLNPRVPKHIGS